MSDSYSNWTPSLNIVASNEDEEEQNGELFLQNRPFGPRTSFFQNELNNLSQLAKHYQNIPTYGNVGPLTDDEKRGIERRNNAFVPEPSEADDQQRDAEHNTNDC